MSIDSEALEIYDAALDIADVLARAAFIERRCAGDEDLRLRVQRMFDVGDAEFKLLATESFLARQGPPMKIPERIGAYKIIEEISRGGMGTVVKAARDDGVYEQTVAIKLIRGDIASARARARFDAERRILARLNHPSIVRILDGGDVGGHPWLAMDLVPGKPITEMLTQLAPSREERFNIFERLCDAIAYAHRNLVIHADIKPSNILMMPDLEIRVVDFGIAHLMAGIDIDEAGDPYPLTRGYAAPERAKGKPPTIASDVFSLGVLLHEVLTDKKLLPGSARADNLKAQESPARMLPFELAAIITKATQINPEARYADVAALLSDIRRYRHHIPVTAIAAPGGWYRARSFFQRHRTGALMTGGIMAILVATSAISTTQYLRAERERRAADMRFADARHMAKYILFDVYDDLRDIPDTTKARADIAREGQTYLAVLATQRQAGFDVRFEAIQGLFRVAEIMGAQGSPSLANSAEAGKYLDQTFRALVSLSAQYPDHATLDPYFRKAAMLRCQHMLYGSHDAKMALALAQEGEQHRRDLVAPGAFDISLWGLRMCKGDALTWLNQTKAAITVLRATLSDARSAGLTHGAFQNRLYTAKNEDLLGEAYLYDKDDVRAIAALEQAYADLSTLRHDEPQNEANLNGLVSVSDALTVEYQKVHKDKQALKIAQYAYAATQEAADKDPLNKAAQSRALGLTRVVAEEMVLTGHRQAAIALTLQAHQKWKNLLRSTPDAATYRKYILSLRPAGDVFLLSGDRKQACAYYTMQSDEWRYFDKKWGISPSDRTEGYAAALQNEKACAGQGKFAT